MHACMEATGNYSEALAFYLFDAGHQVSIINPAVINASAQSHLSHTRTDKVDATLIAQFCQERKPLCRATPQILSSRSNLRSEKGEESSCSTEGVCVKASGCHRLLPTNS